ncbi:hypothetical protein BDZ89DRAFT_1071462 [Hymenopellis radicata]|nr:hypothetical protein BDZ89DRAFT_1071462 [Hymenopellis radicata]
MKAVQPRVVVRAGYYQDLQILGEYLLKELVGVAVESFFWGAYALLFAYALRSQLGRRARNYLMIGVLCFLFASSTALWAMDFAMTYVRLKIGTTRMGMDMYDRIIEGNKAIEPLGLPMEALFLVNMLVGDSVVIWRAWVLWTGVSLRKRIIAFMAPAVILTISLIFAIIALVCLGESSFSAASSSPLSDSRTCLWAEPISWALSLLTNVVTTALVGVMAWEHRRLLMIAPGQLHSKSKVNKIMVLLVESGFIYCLFWLTQVINFIEMPDGNIYYLYFVLSRMGDQISGLYPTVIIVLVSLQQTVYDQTVGTLKLETMVFEDNNAMAAGDKFTPAFTRISESQDRESDSGSDV